MKIAVLGTGYVGLSTGVCLSEIGHNVTCIDINKEKIKHLRQGILPIYEPGLEALLASNITAGRLRFTTDRKELKDKEIIIIAVGTPQREDGEADLSYIEQAAKDISGYIAESSIIVIKSTVPVGTNEYIKKTIEKECGFSIQIISNPEFLRQGSAIHDTMNADRIIIGYENKAAAMKLQEMYRPLNLPILLTSIRSAEMIKYASNAFLATKISFINAMANICEAVGANIEDVAQGMGKDKRIGEAFLKPGIGYGGSCFPKDVEVLHHTASLYGINSSLLKETIEINESQKDLLVKKALIRFGKLKGKKITMLGLAFKPDTDDMREAPSINIARSLTSLGAEVVAYDPAAMINAKGILGDKILFANSVDEAVWNADALFIVTEWQEFQQLNLPTVLKKMKHPIIFDGRNCFKEDRIKACETIEYYSIGRPDMIVGIA
ncbi:UDP-glucose/GDP-mannose dehydrogenase family protein [Peribacillus saganii]|uniref:UDP-glucose 6-dehydrogenase n=1 Tax=Peribacillus saganii TaxID=2303992 RepID=A0A372LEK8_9BACI|nr:UDP-glucose/GDP-mannose dehydrogenase family protein [Peribacillus saganii]RFU64428.1 UDP-glucose/GDP-mannose dehydrogenase family protein [Peribacillus saganii]